MELFIFYVASFEWFGNDFWVYIFVVLFQNNWLFFTVNQFRGWKGLLFFITFLLSEMREFERGELRSAV